MATKEMVYGYARISRKQQSIERQIRNILSVNHDAKIYQEAYTGTKIEGRKVFEKLIKAVRTGDTIIFDSVSRMSRNAEEGIKLYKELYNNGVNLVFIKEPYINTETYKNATRNAVPMTGTNVDLILRGVNEYLMILAEEQIKIAFDQAQKEVDDLHERTREGILTAKLNGKQIGRPAGKTYKTKAGEMIKERIQKHAKEFGGTLSDKEIMSMSPTVARNTYYKYKREVLEGI